MRDAHDIGNRQSNRYGIVFWPRSSSWHVDKKAVREMAASTAAASPVIFKVGEKFKSIEEFEKKLDAFKKKEYVEFWRRDSRTIDAARKRGIDRPLKTELRYYEAKYCCIHGGRVFKPRGNGSRCTS